MAISDNILCAAGSPYQPDYACVLTPGHGEGHCFVPMTELYSELERRAEIGSHFEDKGYQDALVWIETVLLPIRETMDYLTSDDAIGKIDAAIAARPVNAT